ncbi:hypothetical protein QZH41_009732, partial [Actinostola sp. cb2023]
IDCITFQNNYTASIEIKAKVKEELGENDVWKVCLKRHTLMSRPHYEAGSQDYITITTDMGLPESDDVAELMQHMWAVTQEMKAVTKPERPIGRFD